MQTKDHLALGRYLARVFEIEEPVKKYAFVIGNIMPMLTNVHTSTDIFNYCARIDNKKMRDLCR